MRSRFAAFATAEVEYLWRTLHADHDDRRLPKDEVVRGLRSAASAHKYMRLTILDAEGDRVLFLANVFEKGRDRSFVELSTFAREASGWRYLAGETRALRDIDDIAALTIHSFSAALSPSLA